MLREKEIVHGKIQLRADGILSFEPNVATFKNYDLEVLQDLLEAFVDITDGIPKPYLCDNRYVTGIVSKKEQEYMNENFGKFATKAALLSNSTILRIIVNSYNMIFKPKVEVKLFGDEEKAINWLLS